MPDETETNDMLLRTILAFSQEAPCRPRRGRGAPAEDGRPAESRKQRLAFREAEAAGGCTTELERAEQKESSGNLPRGPLKSLLNSKICACTE